MLHVEANGNTGEREPGEDKLLLPHKFKISNKALVSNREHGVIFVSC